MRRGGEAGRAGRTWFVAVAAGGALLALVVTFGGVLLVQRDDPRRPEAPDWESLRDCTVDARLVNSCRPWFGATANGYEDAEEWNPTAQRLGFELRAERRMDVVHTYHVAGDNELSETDLLFAKRPRTLLYTNWQPTMDWTKADGGNSEVNADIDQMARSIKALGRTRIMLALFHEPENDLGEFPESCPDTLRPKGSSGTPEDYRTMWRTVQSRFKALGVTNVVWVMNYMGYPPFNCMVEALYPGDDRVDWITFNAYAHGDDRVSFTDEIRPMYDFLTESSGPGHDYLSKAWGLAEWGISRSSQATAYGYYRQAHAAIEGNVFPRLKLYLAFDSVDWKINDGSYRVGYAFDGSLDPKEQAVFNEVAHSPALNGPWRWAG